MRRLVLIAGAFLALASFADAQPAGPAGQENRPRPEGGRPPGGGRPANAGRPPGESRPPNAGRPPGEARPPNAARPPHEGRPPNAGRPPGGGPPPQRPPAHRPPAAAPGYNRPNTWHAPRGSQWYWHGRWVGRVPGPAFRYPPGYSYRRWSAGAVLPGLFLSATFFYAGYATLGLPPPSYGAQWVRYGPDLLLVDLATGRIIDVAYGVFY